MNIKVILIDVGGVLVRFVDSTLHRKWEKRLGLRRHGLIREIHKKEPADLATIGVIDGKTLWEDVQRKFSLTDEELHQLRKDYYSPDAVNMTLYNYLKRLRPQYKIVILSNAWKDARRIYTERYKLDQVTDQMILSAEEGMVKPHKKMFKLALRRLGVQPEETLLIDDSKKNIKAAAEMGMQTVLFTHTEESIEKIEAALKSA